jgi:hypothetical protein
MGFYEEIDNRKMLLAKATQGDALNQYSGFVGKDSSDA